MSALSLFVLPWIALATPTAAPTCDQAALPTAAACLVFAPSQVAALAALVELGRAPPLVAIGPTTATALAAHGAPARAVAATPDPAGMAAALASVYPPG